MKLLLSFIFLTNTAMACNYSKDITRNDDGSYRYTRLCHISIGKSLTELDLTTEKVTLLEKKLDETYKVLDLEARRAEMWTTVAKDYESLANKLEKERYLWFGGGVLLTVLSVYLAGQVK